jgi:hypothetical protein
LEPTVAIEIAIQLVAVALLAFLTIEIRALRRRLEALMPPDKAAPIPYGIEATAESSVPGRGGSLEEVLQQKRAEEVEAKPLEASGSEKLPPPAYRPRRPVSLEMGLGGSWRRRFSLTPMRSPEEVAELVRKAKERKRREEGEGGGEGGAAGETGG